jgi:hypothetical protein
MSHPSDYKVSRKTGQQLAKDAQALRLRIGVDNRVEFDPFLAIRLFETEEAVPRKGILKVVPFNAPKGCPKARVKYKPLGSRLITNS